MSDMWYVAEPDGETWGPYAYPDLLRAAAAKQFAAGSLVWHADLGEWQPLSKHTAGATSPAPTVEPMRTTATSSHKTAPRQKPAQKKKQPANAAKPPPMPGSPQSRAQVEAMFREAQAKKGVLAADAKQNAAESARRLAWVGKRLAARYIDVFSLGLFGACLWWAATSGRSAANAEVAAEGWLLLIMALPVWFVIESVLLGLFGTTPGKWLMGLRVRTRRDGGAPGVPRAFRRSFVVYARGLAFGLAIFTPIAILIAGIQTLNKGEAPWDSGLIVDDHGANVQWQVIGFLLVLLWIAAVEGWWLQLATMLMR